MPVYDGLAAQLSSLPVLLLCKLSIVSSAAAWNCFFKTSLCRLLGHDSLSCAGCWAGMNSWLRFLKATLPLPSHHRFSPHRMKCLFIEFGRWNSVSHDLVCCMCREQQKNLSFQSWALQSQRKRTCLVRLGRFGRAHSSKYVLKF